MPSAKAALAGAGGLVVFGLLAAAGTSLLLAVRAGLGRTGTWSAGAMLAGVLCWVVCSCVLSSCSLVSALAWRRMFPAMSLSGPVLVALAALALSLIHGSAVVVAGALLFSGLVALIGLLAAAGTRRARYAVGAAGFLAVVVSTGYLLAGRWGL